jgi:hypothetical protein
VVTVCASSIVCNQDHSAKTACDSPVVVATSGKCGEQSCGLRVCVHEISKSISQNAYVAVVMHGKGIIEGEQCLGLLKGALVHLNTKQHRSARRASDRRANNVVA